MLHPPDVSQRLALLWTHHSAINNVSKWPLCHSSNSVGYISRLLWTNFIQYRLCSYLDNSSSSPSLNLTTACCSRMFHTQTRRLCSWGSCCACQEAASHYFASSLALFLRLLTCLPRAVGQNFSSPPCSCFHWNFTSPLLCSFLRAWTTIWNHISQFGSDALVAQFWLLSVAQIPALASSLLPPGATLIKLMYCSLSLW